MNPIAYLKKNGVKRALEVIYQYKLDLLLYKLVLPFVRRKPLKDTIVIESHNDFDCNGGAFYDFLIQNGYNRRYKIVWLLKNKRPKQKMPENVVLCGLHRPSFRKAYHVCTAKYLTADSEITERVRPEQISIFCNHGAVGLKSVRGLYWVPESVSYMLCPSENHAAVQAREFSLNDGAQRFIYTGYPFHDVFYHDSVDEVAKLTDRKFDKVFLWMPTFRKGGNFRRNDSTAEQPYGIPLIETEEMLQQLQHFLEERNCLLIIKIHPMQDPSTLERLHGSDNIQVLTGQTVKELEIDNYRLLKCVDALISDYSTISYSYILLDRPVAFVLSDQKEYKLEMSVDNLDDFLVGNRIYGFRDLFDYLTAVQNGEDPYRQQRRELTQWLYKYQDGNSCQRLADFLGLEKP